jgi:hypothetical protein
MHLFHFWNWNKFQKKNGKLQHLGVLGRAYFHNIFHGHPHVDALCRFFTSIFSPDSYSSEQNSSSLNSFSLNNSSMTFIKSIIHKFSIFWEKTLILGAFLRTCWFGYLTSLATKWKVRQMKNLYEWIVWIVTNHSWTLGQNPQGCSGKELPRQMTP